MTNIRELLYHNTIYDCITKTLTLNEKFCIDSIIDGSIHKINDVGNFDICIRDVIENIYNISVISRFVRNNKDSDYYLSFISKNNVNIKLLWYDINDKFHESDWFYDMFGVNKYYKTIYLVLKVISCQFKIIINGETIIF